MALLLFSLLPINIIHIEDKEFFKNFIYTVLFNIEKQRHFLKFARILNFILISSHSIF